MGLPVDQITISPAISLFDAIKKMDAARCKLLIIEDGGRFVGLLSIGDVQRAIIRNMPMSAPVSEIDRTELVVCSTGDTEDHIRGQMLKHRTVFMPVLAPGRRIERVVFWDDVFGGEPPRQAEKRSDLDIPVVIMAGGKGVRLQPLTNVLPKPLLPFGSKTIIENIMDRFVHAGCRRFFLSLNYKASMIRQYFSELPGAPYDISFFEENKPLGTGGSLSLIRDRLTTPFFVSNCDIIIDQDLSVVWDYHRKNGNEMTIVAALKHVKLAYGSLVTGEDGLLKELSEKPEWVFKVNSGVYVLEPHVLSEIPENAFYNMTDLVDAILRRGGRVGVFPVSEASWSDIGNWDDFNRVLRQY